MAAEPFRTLMSPGHGASAATLLGLLAWGAPIERRHQAPTPDGKQATTAEPVELRVLRSPTSDSTTRLLSAAVDARGNVFVKWSGDRWIVQYDALGRRVRNVGGGTDPRGAYTSVSAMGGLSAGGVVVVDGEGARIIWFDGAGRVAGTYRVRRALFPTPGRITDRDDRVYVEVARSAGAPEGEFVAHQVLRLRSGRVSDSLGVPARTRTRRAFVQLTPEGPRASFPAETLWTVAYEGGVLVAHSEAMAIWWDRGQAPRARVLSRAVTPVPVSAQERQDWLALASRTSGGGRKYEVPRVKPIIRRLHSDDDGRIWVDRYVVARNQRLPPTGDQRPRLGWRERPTFEVFKTNGTALGTVSLPWGAEFLAARGENLWYRRRTAAGDVVVQATLKWATSS